MIEEKCITPNQLQENASILYEELDSTPESSKTTEFFYFLTSMCRYIRLLARRKELSAVSFPDEHVGFWVSPWSMQVPQHV